MSGGFFRGTSADQDTRFSNKQAKLLKTQKFAPELDHLVDMTKVKMDVMKPWIARRVTEMLGFEDEVLINFVYGLLDGKEVDGKQIQIQLTGFMEKNTGKFMRELWGFLLSAQKNASGVPQQFLDEKEEEMRKKKVESDRITQEIQRKKEKEEQATEYSKHKRMDGEADFSRHVDAASDADLKLMRRDSSPNPEEEGELDGRNGSGRTSRQHSPSPQVQSPSVQRSTHAKSSTSRSFSNSRSYSEDGHKSRSISVSASPPRCSTSQDRIQRSPPRYSVSPHRRRSPQIPRSSSRQRLPYLRRRSSSRSRHRSPSPVRRRSPSPVRRRSPPPVRRRSPVRVRRRSPSSPSYRFPSPLRHRSPAPLRRRSPSPPRPRYQSPPCRRHRSPSPSWHRSPLRRRSPVKLRRRSPSPARLRSPSPQQRPQSPVRRSSPSSFRRRLPRSRSPIHRRISPFRHAVDSRSSPRPRNRTQNLQPSVSPSQSRRTWSREHANHADGVESGRNRRSPAYSFRRDENEKADLGRSRVDSPSERQQNVRPETHAKKSHSLSDERGMSKSGNRIHSPSRSPARRSRGWKDHYNSPGASRGENADARESTHQKINSSSKRGPYSPTRASGKLSKRSASGDSSPEKLAVKEPVHARGNQVDMHVRGNQVDMKLKERHEQRTLEHPESRTQKASHLSEDVEYGPGKVDGKFVTDGIDNKRPSSKHLVTWSSSPDERSRKEKNLLENSYSKEASRTDEKKRSREEDNSSSAEKSRKKLDDSYQVGPADTNSEEDEMYRTHKTEKKSKKSQLGETAPENEADYDSALDYRKEAKRRRKEEKRMRKEEKRKRREERHRKREERRAQKKAKYADTVTPPPDYERNNDVADDSDDDAGLRVSKSSDAEETECEQKKLEIELRNKALESLRAKKAISH